jgi:hypothetical protein
MSVSSQPPPKKIRINQKQLENVEYFNYLGRMITNKTRYTREIKSRNAMTKAAFNMKKTLFSSKFDENLRKKLVNLDIRSIALCGTECAIWKVHQKYLESFKIWYCRRVEKISLTYRVRNEEVVHRVKKARNILNTINRRKANWIFPIFRRNYVLKHVIRGKGKGRNY